jgi:hypothetical protein
MINREELESMITSLDEAREEQLNPVLLEYIENCNENICLQDPAILGSLWVFDPSNEDYLYIEVLLDTNIPDQYSPLYQQVNRRDEIKGFEMYIKHMGTIDEMSYLYRNFMTPLWDNIFILKESFIEIFEATDSEAYTKVFLCE